MIYLISGKARHGKDTLALEIKRELENKNRKVLILHFADPLKDIATKYFDWDGRKDDKGRQILIDLGRKARAIDPLYWVKKIEDLIILLEDMYDDFIIPDTRYINEANFFLDNYSEKAKILRVARKPEDIEESEKLSEKQQQDLSETDMDNYYKYSYIFLNYGTIEDLGREAGEYLV